MQDPENQLGIILQNSGINIRSVTRALSEDLLKIMPQDVNIVNKTFNFVNLVQTGAPADLKNNALDGSGNANNSDQYSFDFSIWSRKWEPNMSSDYLGNYGFGYIGADYWQGFDFDDAVDSISRLNDSISDYHNSNNNDIYLALLRSGVEFFRDGNPDKTDAEIFCRVGAGIAQLKSDDFNVKKYIENVKNGNWGDNVGDSEMIGEGFNAYYNVHGIDKAQTIKEERK